MTKLRERRKPAEPITYVATAGRTSAVQPSIEIRITFKGIDARPDANGDRLETVRAMAEFGIADCFKVLDVRRCRE